MPKLWKIDTEMQRFEANVRHDLSLSRQEHLRRGTTNTGGANGEVGAHQIAWGDR